RIFSAYVKEMDIRPSPTSWGAKIPFGELLFQSGEKGGWVHGVCFSPNGEFLAWVDHNSCVNVADSTRDKTVTRLSSESLPFLTLLFVNESQIVTAGHDCAPYLFLYTGSGNLEFVGKIEGQKETAKSTSSAMNHFRNLDKKGTRESNSTEVSTLHQNSISQLSIMQVEDSKITAFSSSGIDGALVIWSLKG
ncbi:hypothetical protein GDO86_017931, partial [Hymenochirus boettgeri]